MACIMQPLLRHMETSLDMQPASQLAAFSGGATPLCKAYSQERGALIVLKWHLLHISWHTSASPCAD